MSGRTCRWLMLCIAMLATHAFGGEQTTYHGCVDGRGARVEAVLDESLATTFESRIEEGRAIIRYNPAILPRLKAESRLLLYAHQCAQLSLGARAGGTPAIETAHKADCLGLETLLRSGLIAASDVDDIQSDLRFSATEWAAVPGPPREFDLPACHRELAGRPSLASPSAGQASWNTCTHACGEVLRSCQARTCNESGCEPCVGIYDKCVRGCDQRRPD